MSKILMNEFNQAVFDIVKHYAGKKLPYGIACKELSISEGALVKSLLYLIDVKALSYPGGPNSRVFFVGSTPSNWHEVMEQAILDALVELLRRFEGRPLKMNFLRSILGPGPEDLRLRDQLNRLKELDEISEPVKGTYFLGEPPEDWMRELLKPKSPKENGILYHRHSEDSDPHLRAKVHHPDDLQKEAEEKDLDAEMLICMHT